MNLMSTDWWMSAFPVFSSYAHDMTTKTPSAGQKLRDDLAAALRHASEELGRQLEFDEAELHVIEQAANAADRAEELTRLYKVELGKPEPHITALTKLAAEIRFSEKAAIDYVARVNLGLGAAKSPRHVRAARTRWQQHSVQAR
jgi:acyl-CoA reductase-like NAD-dependent aldehyde dehydrogenase